MRSTLQRPASFNLPPSPVPHTLGRAYFSWSSERFSTPSAHSPISAATSLVRGISTASVPVGLANETASVNNQCQCCPANKYLNSEPCHLASQIAKKNIQLPQL